MHTTLRETPQPLGERVQPRLGDDVVIARDALLEIQLPRRATRTWRLITAGTRGRLVARHDGICRVVLADGPEAAKVALVGETPILRAPDDIVAR